MLGLSQTLCIRQKLSHAQKQELKQLTLSQSQLRHLDIPYAATGIEGMLTAHDILKEKGDVGVLIGGLSEHIWSQRTKPEDLKKHKDVDVLVLSPANDYNLFEGGIDWWLPRSERLKIPTLSGYLEGTQNWWENGYDTVMSFGVSEYRPHEPGL